MSAIDRAAVRAPAALGVNVTLIVQLAPMANVDPQVEVLAKFDALVPVREMPPIAIAALPVLDSVTLLAPLVVLTVWVPKATVAGVRLATGLIPAPLRDIS